jgi:hypothetical protein
VKSDLRQRISAAVNAADTHDPYDEAARAAMTFFAEMLEKYGTSDMPFSHADDCDWPRTAPGPCDCGFDDLHYDLIWARMYPTPRKEKTDG